MDLRKFTEEGLRSAAPVIFAAARSESSLEAMRRRLCQLAEQLEFDTFYECGGFEQGSIIRVRDSARVFRSLLSKRSEDLAEFSVARAIRDLARGQPRPDLTPAFHAELYHLMLGLQGRGPGKSPADQNLELTNLKGRDAAIERSRQLDVLAEGIESRIRAFPHGALPTVLARRKQRKQQMLEALHATDEDWNSWTWQLRHVIRDENELAQHLTLGEEEREAVRHATGHGIPFGITPHYLSLMDERATAEDRPLRAQVIPPLEYVTQAAASRQEHNGELDFMRERDTSPIDLITRRYPGIVIFKPYNTCPQICVYCQRNWEIAQVLAPTAAARADQVAAALAWIRSHPGVREVLVTGGDPLIMSDEKLRRILQRLADIPSIERIRIGTRTLVTLPMRITAELADLLGSLREPGRREIAMVTHVQHPCEVTPETLHAAERIRSRQIPIYNQLVYTFYVSRRFEAAALRRILRLAGITPYYTFNTKAKAETQSYRVPVARLVQEQKEEARLLPGMVRTDEAVFNVPGMGKNYLRARHHRAIISILPDGARVYEYYPWDKHISGRGALDAYVTRDVPILDYLERLERIGEDVSEYDTIWYYY